MTRVVEMRQANAATVARAQRMLAEAPALPRIDVHELLTGRITGNDRQLEMFAELVSTVRPPVKPPKPGAKAHARRQLVRKLTLKGKLITEIAMAANCTTTHVLRIRAALRKAGQLPPLVPKHFGRNVT